MKIEFTIPSIPIAQPRQRHRIVNTKSGKQFTQNYTMSKHPVNAFKATARLKFSEIYNGSPILGPVKLTTFFIMPRPKNKIWKTKQMPRYAHTKKPDIDNLVKALKDALTGLAWKDDSQIWSVYTSKITAGGNEQPRCEVTIVNRTFHFF